MAEMTQVFAKDAAPREFLSPLKPPFYTEQMSTNMLQLPVPTYVSHPGYDEQSF